MTNPPRTAVSERHRRPGLPTMRRVCSRSCGNVTPNISEPKGGSSCGQQSRRSSSACQLSSLESGGIRLRWAQLHVEVVNALSALFINSGVVLDARHIDVAKPRCRKGMRREQSSIVWSRWNLECALQKNDRYDSVAPVIPIRPPWCTRRCARAFQRPLAWRHCPKPPSATIKGATNRRRRF